MYIKCIEYTIKMKNKQFILTKKIAKHGKQAIIVIPKFLQNTLRPKTLVKLTIDILEEGEKNDKRFN